MPNLLNMLEKNSGNEKTARKEVVSVLIGKAWVKEAKGFNISPLTEPNPAEAGQYRISSVYPLIITDYCSIRFGINGKCDVSKNQNSHWAFLNVEKDRLAEYKELLGKIGQNMNTEKKA